jgi:hypothetical protein
VVIASTSVALLVAVLAAALLRMRGAMRTDPLLVLRN